MATSPQRAGRPRNPETSRTPLRQLSLSTERRYLRYSSSRRRADPSVERHSLEEEEEPESTLEEQITHEELLLSRSRRLSRPWVIQTRRAVMHFTPSWFACSMGTGITAILAYSLPYQFEGLHVIALVIFVLNLVLFVSFFIISLARYLLWPSIWYAMLRHPSQSLFLGCFPMALSTIVNMMSMAVAPAWGGGWITFTWILWWINVVLAVTVGVGVPYQMFAAQVHAPADMTAAWLLPTVATIVAAASGSIVAEILPPSHARLTVVVSYVLWGTGFPVAFLLLGLLHARLAIHKIPAGAQVISTFLPLGPTGSGAYGILHLASAVRKLGSNESSGSAGLVSGGLTADEGRTMGLAVYAASMPIGLAIWGFGAIWAAIAVLSVIHRVRHEGSIEFSLGAWALTFPLGVFATSTTLLGHQLESAAFDILGTVFSGIVFVNWLLVSGLTIINALRGKLLVAPCLSEMVPRERRQVARQRRRGAAASPSPTTPAADARASVPPPAVADPSEKV